MSNRREKLDIQRLDAVARATFAAGNVGVFHVRREGVVSAFGYTVGLESFEGHPELVICGLGSAATQDILELAAKRVRSGSRLEPGMVLHEITTGPVVVRPVDARVAASLFQAGSVLQNRQVRALQLVYQMAGSFFPWELDPAKAMTLGQPLLAPTSYNHAA